MDKLKKVLLYSFLIVVAMVTLFPFVWMLLTSLKTLPETMQMPPKIFPEQLMFSNYITALNKAPFATYFFNSVFTALASTTLLLIVTITSGFAFAKYDFKGKNLIFTILLTTLMIPGEMLIITNFDTIAKLGLYDTRVALFLPYLSSIFYIFLIRQFFMTVPHELYLSAKVDGSSDLQFLLKILIPISKPVIITVSMLNIVASWNSYLWPLIITNSVEKRTLPIGLMQFTTDAGTEYNLLMAASTIIIIPIIILFIVSRKYIVAGLTKGSVKG
ncbi:carbohydrate ABC transporter permease [Mollicutes bacterium LVI A0039]|nr:carbohydrate ABC transporter permease [Mollicutes bacterium LVI A0039]